MASSRSMCSVVSSPLDKIIINADERGAEESVEERAAAQISYAQIESFVISNGNMPSFFSEQ